jgi:hypothetical protein
MKKHMKVPLVALILIIVLVVVLLLFFKKTPPPEPGIILPIKDIESNFGEISDYRRVNETPVGVTAQESSTTTLKNKKTSLGSQIIQYKTNLESKNIFDLHVANFQDVPHDEEKNITIGENGVIYKIDMGDENTFFLLFYKDKSFVSLTLNYAKDSDEKELVDLAKTIEENLNTTTDS